MTKIKIATPIYRCLEPETDASITNIVNTSKHAVSWSKFVGDSLISRVRNGILKVFLNAPFDYLMFIDADIVWLVENIKYENNPIDLLASHNVDIVGGVYPVKGEDCHPSLRQISHQKKFEEEKKWGNWEHKIPNSLFEVQYISAGFLMLSRKCIAKICEKYWYPFTPMEGINNEYLSEDWAFCHRAKEMGLKIFADPTIKLGHIGKYTFTLHDYEQRKNIKK